MEVDTKVFFNILCDLKKKEIHPVERAEMLKAYLKEEGISVRRLASELGMPHSTIQDWLDYGRLSVKQFNKMTSAGMTRKEIHKVLRGSRNIEKIDEVVDNELNRKLRAAQALLAIEISMAKDKATKITIELIKDLENTLKRLKDEIRGRT